MAKATITDLEDSPGKFAWLLVDRKTVLRRLMVWIGETAALGILVAVILNVLSMISMAEFDPGRAILGIAALPLFTLGVLFIAFPFSGFIVTTLVTRIFWSSTIIWSYPCIAALLFFVHCEIFFRSCSPEPSTPIGRIATLVIGAACAFGCTSLGSQKLKRHSALTV